MKASSMRVVPRLKNSNFVQVEKTLLQEMTFFATARLRKLWEG